MNDFELNNNLIKEIKELADSKYSTEFSSSALWGCASALLTAEQLKIIKSVVGSR
jgi:hypothetical protein